MARSIRIEYADAVYHVLCRGDRREEIFRNAEDFGIFLATWEEVCARTGFKVHAYVLMPNHYHLLLETPEPNLVAGMKWFQGAYTQRFNRRHRISGHLFQGRYKALPVDPEDPVYFRRLSEYIHLNPARARLLNKAGPDLIQYPWSSYPVFVQAHQMPVWLVRERVFASCDLPDEGRASRRRYRMLMQRRVAECGSLTEAEQDAEAWKDIRRGWYVGSETFRDRLLDRIDARLKGHQRASYRKEGLARHDEREAVRLLERGCDMLGVTLPELWGRRQSDATKQALAWWVKSHCVVTDAWLSTKLEMGSRTNVHRAVKAYRIAADRHRKSLKLKLQQCSD